MFKAKFKLDGLPGDYVVRDYEVDFSQPTDQSGKPRANPVAGFIKLVVEANTDSTLAEWMISPTQAKSGSITFTKGGGSEKKAKQVNFKEGFCVGYSEKYNFGESTTMVIRIHISAKEIDLGNNAKFTSTCWPT